MNQNEKIGLDLLVLEAAKNSWKNDYRIWQDENELATDMVCYDADLEDYEIKDVKASLIRQKLLEYDPRLNQSVIKLPE